MIRFLWAAWAVLTISAVACSGSSSSTPLASADAVPDAAAPVPTASPDAGAPADAGGDASPSRFAFDVPVTPHVGGTDGTFATVELTIGNAPPITALLDTGSVGLRFVTGTIPASAFTATGITAGTESYGSGVRVDGSIVSAVVALAGHATPAKIGLEEITAVSCAPSTPNCAANGVAAKDFRFRGEYPAIMGVGLRTSKNLASPIAALTSHGQYVLSYGAFGSLIGVVRVDPTADEVARFAGNLVQLTSNGQTSTSGVPGWDDTQFPLCVNAFCTAGLLDTGGNAAKLVVSGNSDYTKLGVPTGSTTVPGGTAVTVKLATNASWSFTVADPPTVGKDLINLGNGGLVGTNFGCMPYFQKDVLYDYVAGKIGIAGKD